MFLPKRGRLFSLKSRLIRVVLICWILPLLLITLITGFVVVRSIDRQTTETVRAAAMAAAELCVHKIDAAVEASRRASYDRAIKEAYLTYIRTGDYLRFYSEVDDFLSHNYRFDDKCKFASLYFYTYGDEISESLRQTQLRTINQPLLPNPHAESGQYAYQLYREQDLKPITIAARALGTALGFMNRDGRFYVYRNLYIRGPNPTAIFIMRLNTSGWFESLPIVPWGQNITLAVNQEVIEVSGEALDIFALLREGSPQEENMPENQTARVLRLRNPAWLSRVALLSGSNFFSDAIFLAGALQGGDYVLSYAVQVDHAVFMKQISQYLYAVYAIVLLVIPFLLYILRFFSRHISAAIQILTDASQKIQSGDFGLQAPSAARSEEFSRLTDSFNAMSAQLKTQIDKIYREEANLRDAKIRALQSQINPHFLGNTLEIINWEARLGDNEKVTRMIEALSTMMDAAIGRDGRRAIPLSEELRYVEAYLYIIGERFGQRLTIQKEIDVSLLDYYVPRLILQPAVENAIEHGVAAARRGTVSLRAYQINACLALEVENSGALSAEDTQKIDKILSGDGFLSEGPADNPARLGLRNIRERLQMIYGPLSGISVTVTKSPSTIFRITIPIHQLNN
ncbi:MAG: sensor histidine kinase [Clostridiales bacterium]|jgi:two-component system sensor histidine kinase YesM|nr:sensor histidine kinase [Clostridiales bacterium]